MIIAEVGGTRLKAGFEISLTEQALIEAATLPMRRGGKILPSPDPGRENLLYRNPVGVVGVISPFNFPLLLGLKVVAPALACGNAVVLKPHEDTPIAGGTVIAEIFAAAGLPAGLLNVVITDPRTVPGVGDALVTHPVPRVIVFTGSAAVGGQVAATAAAAFKQPILELGGNNALIVCEDLTPDSPGFTAAVDAAVFSRLVHAGQACMAANRVLIPDHLYPEFAARVVTKITNLPVGDPRDPSTVIGPLINQRQAETLTTQVDHLRGQGAQVLLAGGVDVDGPPTLYRPTVLGDVTADMAGCRDELFGPVLLLMPVRDDDHAVTVANNSPYGLSGAIHTNDTAHGIRLAHRIHTGMIHINNITIHDEPAVPFGGEKHSGLGRLNGDASLHAFTTTKWISVNPAGERTYPF